MCKKFQNCVEWGKYRKIIEKIMTTYLKFDKIYKHNNLRSKINVEQDKHTQKLYLDT